jgi:integrase
VPVHASTLDRLRQYQEDRDRFHPTPRTSAFFVSEGGRRLPYQTVRGIFRRLCEQLRLHGTAHSRRPRIHDLRHRFTVNTLIRWYREGADAERCLPRLSACLGHGCCEFRLNTTPPTACRLCPAAAAAGLWAPGVCCPTSRPSASRGGSTITPRRSWVSLTPCVKFR